MCGRGYEQATPPRTGEVKVKEKEISGRRCVAKGGISLRWQDKAYLHVNERDPLYWQRQEEEETGSKGE